jgi:hypothetical protein
MNKKKTKVKSHLRRKKNGEKVIIKQHFRRMRKKQKKKSTDPRTRQEIERELELLNLLLRGRDYLQRDLIITGNRIRGYFATRPNRKRRENITRELINLKKRGSKLFLSAKSDVFKDYDEPYEDLSDVNERIEDVINIWNTTLIERGEIEENII